MSLANDNEGAEVPAEVRSLFNESPRPQYVEVFCVDLNGVMRGKRLPLRDLPQAYTHGLCMPASALLLDIEGEDIRCEGVPGYRTGDGDHYCKPVLGSLRPVPWSERRSVQLLLQMFTPDRVPFVGDPRNILMRVLHRLAERNLSPVIAVELEFYLFEAEPGADGTPRAAHQASRYGYRSQLYGLDELTSLDPLLADVVSACTAQRLPMDTLLAEQGAAQYEVNLLHGPDALLAADQAVLLKRTIKHCAQRHGMMASFMAKPFGDAPGSGLHVHVNLVDRNGHNVFSDRTSNSTLLTHAIAGLVETMPDAMLIFAPHANSYRRFQAGSHAPTAATWGTDNRTTALRLPLSTPDAARIEHRVAGTDANPYLVLAAILAGMDYGIERSLAPPSETHGNAYASSDSVGVLPDGWADATARYEGSQFIADYFGTEHQMFFSACKRQEREKLRRIVPLAEYDRYLSTV